MHWTEIAERPAGDVVVLDVRGQVALADEPASLYHAVAGLAARNRRKVLLNLEHVSHIDSIGIGEIIRAYTLLAQEGGTLRLCNVAARIREVLAATQLDTILGVFNSERTALQLGFKEAE